MGKGDQRSRRGKIHRGTFGKRRQKPAPPKRAMAADGAEAAGTMPAREKKEPKLVKKQPKE